MLKLILGRAGSGKTTAVYRRMCGAGAERPQVLLVPEQNSHEAERALCKVGGNGVSLYAEVLSFSRLANRVFLAAGGLGEAELDAGGRPAADAPGSEVGGGPAHRVRPLSGAGLFPPQPDRHCRRAEELPGLPGRLGAGGL